MHEKLESLQALTVAPEQPTSLTSERSFTGAGASLDCTDGLGLSAEASGGSQKPHHAKAKSEKGTKNTDLMRLVLG